MRILVTGGAGFIGSHLIETLQDCGHEVIGFDTRQMVSTAAFRLGDLLDLDDCMQATREVDVVCHLGAIGDVYLAFDQPALAAQANVVGTANIMDAALRNQVRKVIYASTWEVYGLPLYRPIDEAHPCNPDHPYNITKLAGEQLALAYDRLKGVNTLALRLGTAYGTGMRQNSVFHQFIRRALLGQPIVINGSGNQFRQFTHVRDIGRAFVLALESQTHGEAINVVSDTVTTIGQLAEMVIDLLPTSIEYEPARTGDIEPSIISSHRAEELLGWKATVVLQEGLKEIIEELTQS
jgi:UDP-glucose 4-epimerase